MQIYYMKKEKISIPVATVILMIVTITYKFVLVAIGVGIAVFGRGFLHRYLTGILPIFYLGLALNIFFVTFMTVLVVACQQKQKSPPAETAPSRIPCLTAKKICIQTRSPQTLPFSVQM